jgi:hypothetical protein
MAWPPQDNIRRYARHSAGSRLVAAGERLQRVCDRSPAGPAGPRADELTHSRQRWETRSCHASRLDCRTTARSGLLDRVAQPTTFMPHCGRSAAGNRVWTCRHLISGLVATFPITKYSIDVWWPRKQ